MAGGGLAASAGTAANAAAGDVVCDLYANGVRNFQVTQVDERNFQVTYVDTRTSFAENGPEGERDEFLPLPEDLRTGTNVIVLGSHATASAPVLSQSIVMGPADEGSDSDWKVEELLHNAPAPWENVRLEGGRMTWTHDVGVRFEPTADGGFEQKRPSDFPFPTFIEPDAASVLEFTVTFPDDISGEVTLVESLSNSYTSTTWGGPSGDDFVWGAGPVITHENPGCSVTLAKLDTDPEGPGTEDPDTDGPGTEDPDTDNPGTKDPETKDPETKDPAVTTKPTGTAQLAESGAEASPALLAASAGALLAAGAGLMALRRKRA